MIVYVLIGVAIAALVCLGIYLFGGSGNSLGHRSSPTFEDYLQRNRLQSREVLEKRQRELDRIRRQQEARNYLQLEGCVKNIIESGDTELIDLLNEGAGNGPRVTKETLSDPDTVRRIARLVKPQTLRVLGVASQSEVQFDQIELELTEDRELVAHPADETELERLQTDDFTTVISEELGMEDDMFFALMADDELHAYTNYEIVRDKRRIYILVDLSGSVAQHMSDGTTRVQKEAGISLRLLNRAKEGRAEYIVRYFGDTPYEVYKVTNEFEAELMARQLLQLTDKGSGTDIMAALEQAYLDVTTGEDEDVHTSDILLITDGESALNATRLEKMFGEDSKIRLHVALIGLENPTLRQFATSYKVYQ